MTRIDSANDIRITRVYDAPVGLVWDAWTDPQQVTQWWGPRGFSITTHRRDLRAGGSWEYTMHGPDGVDYPNFTRYHVVEPGIRLEYDHGASSADTQPMFRVAVLFRDLGGKTELDLRMTLPTADAAQQARIFIKAAGGNATWDRLAEHLEKAASTKEIFVINRSFDAPLAIVFDMWTTPEHLASWLPPTGFTMQILRADIRTGGDAFFAMTNGALTMHVRFEYLQVRRPERVEYTHCFTDAEENISRHPGAPCWPEQMLTTVLFAAEGPAQTRVTVRTEVYGAASSEEVVMFANERTGMTQGWTGSFDKLEGVLPGLQGKRTASSST